ncbi:MAG: hypothetical protein IPO01_04710 [Chitinophagaceae bacterium]|nr:hypothetical protein [Chitinophagaceae bacterium]
MHNAHYLLFGSSLDSFLQHTIKRYYGKAFNKRSKQPANGLQYKQGRRMRGENDTPRKGNPQMPDTGKPEVEKPEIRELPETAQPEVEKTAIEEVPDTAIEEVPDMDIPEIPKPETPD